MIIRKLKYLLLITVIFVFAGSVFSVEAADTKKQTDDDTYLQYALDLEDSETGAISGLKVPSVFSVIIRFFFSLIIIVGLIGIIAFITKKILGGKYLFGGDAQLVKVLAHRYLEPKKSIYIIEVASKVFVLGSSAETINLISEITDADAVREIHTRVSESSPMFRSSEFKNVLSGIDEQYVEPQKEGSSEVQNPVSHGIKSLQHQIEKIKRMLNAR